VEEENELYWKSLWTRGKFLMMQWREEGKRETDKILHLTKRENRDQHPRFLFLGLLYHAIGAAKVQRDAGRMKHELRRR
jgi:hypothetical protein